MKRLAFSVWLGFGIAVLHSVLASADTVVLNGKVYEGVRVYEGRELYYFRDPSDASTITIPKRSLASGEVTISRDEQAEAPSVALKAVAVSDEKDRQPMDSPSVDHRAKGTSATVLSVIRGDALKIRDDRGERLVALYGVHLPRVISVRTSISTQHQDAKDFTSDKVLGNTINVETITQKAGLSYVEIALPDGSILNHLLIEQGLAEVDGLTARNDPLYSQLEQEARDEGRGLWRRNESPSSETAESTPTPRTESAKTFEEFQRDKYIVSVAQFETEYVKWMSLSEDQRSRYVAYLLENREQNQRTFKPLVDSRSRTVRSYQTRIGANQTRIAANSGRVSERRRDFAAVPRVVAESPSGGTVRAPLSRMNEVPLLTTRGEMNRKRAGWDKERAGIGRALSYLAAERSALTAQRNTLEGYLKRADKAREITSRIFSNNDVRGNRKLGRIALLERAIADKYSPYFETSLLTSWTDVGPSGPLLFTTESKLWRIEWFFSRKSGRRSGATVRSVSDGSIVATIVDNRLPHESFLVLDQPGTYSLEVGAKTGVSWELAVVEFNHDGR